MSTFISGNNINIALTEAKIDSIYIGSSGYISVDVLFLSSNLALQVTKNFNDTLPKELKQKARDFLSEIQMYVTELAQPKQIAPPTSDDDLPF